MISFTEWIELLFFLFTEPDLWMQLDPAEAVFITLSGGFFGLLTYRLIREF
jgi:hypothetical protein